jgi:hypothetical protein
LCLFDCFSEPLELSVEKETFFFLDGEDEEEEVI